MLQGVCSCRGENIASGLRSRVRGSTRQPSQPEVQPKQKDHNHKYFQRAKPEQKVAIRLVIEHNHLIRQMMLAKLMKLESAGSDTLCIVSTNYFCFNRFLCLVFTRLSCSNICLASVTLTPPQTGGSTWLHEKFAL